MRSILPVLLIALILCGCTTDHSADEPTSYPKETAVPTVTEPSIEIQTEPSTDPVTEPAETFPLACGSYPETYTDSNTQDYLDYYLFIPENASEDMPLVVFLHGDGEVGKPDSLANFGLIQSAKDIYGESFPFIAISPCTRTTSWIFGTIPDTLMGLIGSTATRFSVNPDKIIITGQSRGAIGVWHLISLYGDYFSAAVPVSCGTETNLNFDNCVAVPIRAIAGNSGEDENNYRRAMASIVEKLQQMGGDAEMIVLENRTHSQTATDAFTPELFEWMLNP